MKDFFCRDDVAICLCIIAIVVTVVGTISLATGYSFQLRIQCLEGNKHRSTLEAKELCR